MGTLSVQVAACFAGWSWPVALVLVPLIIFIGREVNAIQHNHAHLRIFNYRPLNEIIGWMCFMSIGVPLEFYEVHHVKHHHKYNNKFDDDGKDWSSMYGFSGTHYPERPIGMGYYVLTFPILTICHSLIHIIRMPGSKVLRRFALSLVVVGGAAVTLATFTGVEFVIFFLVPWLTLFFGLGIANYLQHRGCDFSSPYHSAKNQINFFGKVGFNVGYHISHHMKPTLHWSELPAHHETIKHLYPADSERGSSA